MKVLYIGHFLESGGWTNAARSNALALNAAGVDVVCRNVTLTRDKRPDFDMAKLLQKDSSKCDVCIQHVLPHHLVGTDIFRKNIAFLESETTSIKHLPWFTQLKQMDEVWVPNGDAQASLVEDGLGIPVSVVYHACDPERYTKKYKDIFIAPADGKFKFYYIGDLNQRKNLESVITCFHSEFTKADNAVLILKVRKFGVNKDELRRIVDDMLMKVKQSLRMYSSIDQYIKDIVITDDVEEDDIYALHRYCDCFVLPSHGEAWSIPTFDAMAFGNVPIASDFGGPVEYIYGHHTGNLVSGVYSACKCQDAAFPDLFTAREYWFTPCEKSIRSIMRMRYEESAKDPNIKLQRKAAGLHRAKDFSYKEVGERMKGLLSE